MPLTHNASPRSVAPVFVLGSPRSGTTLLYDMLLSAGGFAVYLAESNVFNLLMPRFGDLRIRSNREELVEAWLNSKLFRASGLEAEAIRKRLLQECKNGGDFLSIVMGEICAAQGMQRWAENSPEGMLYLPLIKRLIPNALFVHILRDGRDVAASLSRRRFVRAFPWKDRHGLMGCGIYWEWIVEHGRRFGRTIPADYMEIHFEHLVARPQETLNQIGAFIEQTLDYDVIRRVGYGSVAKPNTSFYAESENAEFNPVGRWKTTFTPEQLLRFERLVGKTLANLGYEPATNGSAVGLSLSLRATRLMHLAYFRGKLIYKNNEFIRALLPTMTGADIDEIVQADDHPDKVVQPSTKSS
jgi:sulfotransferase family protein